jgi:hypothetical protein
LERGLCIIPIRFRCIFDGIQFLVQDGALVAQFLKFDLCITTRFRYFVS